ncbi:apolipoprotein M isoform X1 [Latimeria chalumnae]|uniref:apolipoprotein M isoform X1 n=1 Tax=Latimeria chalumnae TaxID=7897 RepID=UPI0006D92DA2|nr:PREDICTED: apolipoprotein M isoform X1 [Latimeria chalumnae]|eukprot:XP_014351893.1 PREDICTED: apolipoprotein M isoform X1 [Latimeria chalumnae]
MFRRVWSYVLYLYGLAVQMIWRCEMPDKVAVGSLDVQQVQQYFGEWYFIAAAADVESTLEIFKPMDNTIFCLQQGDTPERLQLQARIRTDTDCISQNWSYHVNKDREDLQNEGQPQRRTQVFVAKCADCVILEESEDEGDTFFRRQMLYARSPSIDEEFISGFRQMTKCLGLKEFLILPQTKEYCRRQDM